jgi:hypothetical protein
MDIETSGHDFPCQNGNPSDLLFLEQLSNKQLSCIACRQKKVRCDRGEPCSVCQRMGINCTFPPRKHYDARRRNHRIYQSELESRINALERQLAEARNAAPVQIDNHLRQGFDTLSATSATGGMEKEAAVFYPYYPHSTGLRSEPRSYALHLTSDQTINLLSIYFTNVDPVFKVLHRATAESIFLSVMNDQNPNPQVECLFFSIQFAAITSINEDVCATFFEQNRSVLLSWSRSNLETAFTKADLFNSTDLLTLQALVIFLVRIEVIPENFD